MATATLTKPAAKGGSFLLESPQPGDVFTPADLSDDQRLIDRPLKNLSSRKFSRSLRTSKNKKAGLMASLVKKGGEVGLMGGGVPEEYGGAGLDKISTTVLTEKLSIYGGFAVTHGAHAGIGTLPIVYSERKNKKGNTCRSWPPGSGLARTAFPNRKRIGRTEFADARELNAEGTHYILNGQKMWITNGGFADVYIVFAKVDGEKFTAFIVERSFPGFKPGNEEHKMGIHGSSTTPIFLENCKVPKENLLHEIGRGHIVAFQYFECRAVHAGSLVRRRIEARAHGPLRSIARAESLPQTDWRIRDDERKAGGDGHPDFRGGIHGVPLGGKHRDGDGGGFRIGR